MTFLTRIAAAAAVSIFPAMAGAVGLAPGIYSAFDIDRPGEFAPRSIWTSPNMVSGHSANNLWSFDDNALFTYDGVTASLTGSATNTGNTGLTFDFEFNFDFKEDAAAVGNGYCQFTTTRDCTTDDGVNGYTWTYLDFSDGIINGTGTLDSVVWNISEDSGHPPQAGLEANALLHNGLDGFSMWYDWVLDANSQFSDDADKFSFAQSGNGDINTNLEAVPLPAPAFLLIAGLGGLAALRRKKTA